MRNTYKILRITAWILVVLMPIALLSGFFMAKNFLVPWVDYQLSARIHGFLVLLALLPSLYLHSLTGILVSMLRYPALNKKWLKAVIVVVWTAMLGLMVFFLFAQPTAQTTGQKTKMLPTRQPPRQQRNRWQPYRPPPTNTPSPKSPSMIPSTTAGCWSTARSMM